MLKSFPYVHRFQEVLRHQKPFLGAVLLGGLGAAALLALAGVSWVTAGVGLGLVLGGVLLGWFFVHSQQAQAAAVSDYLAGQVHFSSR